MKKFAFFLSVVLPNIQQVNMTDDNCVCVSYKIHGEIQSTLMTLTNYEIAVGHSNKINGLIDRISGLS